MARRIWIGHPQDLILGTAWTLLAAALVIADISGPVRVLVGVPFILVWPGYLLTVALYPGRYQEAVVAKGEDAEATERAADGLGPLERAALSIGLSVALVPLIGLFMNFTPLGIRVTPLVLAIALWNVGAAGFGWRRRHFLRPDERPFFEIDVSLERWRARPASERLVGVLVAVASLVAAGSVAYVLATPNPGEPGTEFYVLGATGTATDYPTHLETGQVSPVEVVVRNHEHETVSYTIRVMLVNGTFTTPDGSEPDPGKGETRFEPGPESVYETWTTRLGASDGHRHQVDVQLPEGDYQLRFELYRDSMVPGVDEPYRLTHLWSQVRPPR